MRHVNRRKRIVLDRWVEKNKYFPVETRHWRLELVRAASSMMCICGSSFRRKDMFAVNLVMRFEGSVYESVTSMHICCIKGYDRAWTDERKVWPRFVRHVRAVRKLWPVVVLEEMST